MNDLQNIQQTQQSYGIPVIGDLFRSKNEDIETTLNSVYAMMKQRVSDIDFRQEIRGKLNKHEATNKELSDQLKALRSRYEQL
jgi:Afadin- and alpha -actinin-Binding